MVFSPLNKPDVAGRPEKNSLYFVAVKTSDHTDPSSVQWQGTLWITRDRHL